MGFKTIDQYSEEKDKGFFTLRNDRDTAKVIFMYRSPKDVLVGDVHYLVTNGYTGYVHCLGAGCPACAKKIRRDTKIFTPLYNIEADQIQFFDRNMKYWEPQLQDDVFKRYGEDATQVIFSITRVGGIGDRNTRYVIQGTNSNNLISYDEICQKFNITFPDHYNAICKDMPAGEMSALLNDSGSNNTNTGGVPLSSLPAYQISPRGAAPEASLPSALPELPEADDSMLDADLSEPDFD